MLVQIPDGMLETAIGAFIALQAWTVRKVYAVDKKLAVLNQRIKDHEESHHSSIVR